MANLFYVKVGFTNIEIANASKILGIFATIIGVFIGGIFVKYYDLNVILLFQDFFKCFPIYFFFFLSEIGPNYNFLLIITRENISGLISSCSLFISAM